MVPVVRAVLATGFIGAGVVSNYFADFFAVPVAWHDLGGGVRFGSRAVVPAGAIIGVPELQRSLLSIHRAFSPSFGCGAILGRWPRLV